MRSKLLNFPAWDENKDCKSILNSALTIYIFRDVYYGDTADAIFMKKSISSTAMK